MRYPIPEIVYRIDNNFSICYQVRLSSGVTSIPFKTKTKAEDYIEGMTTEYVTKASYTIQTRQLEQLKKEHDTLLKRIELLEKQAKLAGSDSVEEALTKHLIRVYQNG